MQLLCDICKNNVEKAFCLKEPLKEIYSLLFEIRSASELDIQICCWCLKTIKNVYRFKKMAQQAQNYIILKPKVADNHFQPPNFYNLQIKSNNCHYDEIINNPVDQCKSIEEIFIKSENVYEKSLFYEQDPIDIHNDNQMNYEMKSEQNMSLRNTNKNIQILKVKFKSHMNIKESDWIQFDSYLISRYALLNKDKETYQFKSILLKEEDILNEKKCKLDKLQASDLKYKCLLCVQSFPHEDKYTDHTSEHTIKPNTILCKFCNIWLSDEIKVIFMHLHFHYVRYECKACSHLSESADDLLLHNSTTHKQNQDSKRTECNTKKTIDIPCIDDESEDIYDNEQIRIDSNKNEKGRKKKWKCHRCGEKFNSNNKRQYHINSIHKNIIYKCDECNKTFKSNFILRTHKDTHKNEYFHCDICKKHIKSKVQFKNHKNQHIKDMRGEKKPNESVYCEICDKTFKTKNIYKQHLKRTSNHQERIKYKCTYCEKTFLDPVYIKEHERLNHLGIGFDCGICNKKFASRNILNKHYLTHGDNIKLVSFVTGATCDICKMTFPTKGILKLHILRKHEDKSSRTRDYICQHCGKGFYSEKVMLVHTRIHSDERPYQCKDCISTFKFFSALYTHNRLVHKKTKNLLQ